MENQRDMRILSVDDEAIFAMTRLVKLYCETVETRLVHTLDMQIAQSSSAQFCDDFSTLTNPVLVEKTTLDVI